MDENKLLEHAVVNQLKKDLNEQNYDPLSELIKNLIHLEPAQKLLVEYLGHDELENWLDGKTDVKY